MPDRIDSPKNPRLKAMLRLRNNRDRKKTGLILIDGVREVSRALAAGVELQEAFACLDWCDDDEARDGLSALRAAGHGVTELSPTAAEALAYGERRSGIIASARRPQRSLGELSLGAAPFVAILEAIEKPGNLGAMLRTADAAGVDAVVLMDSACDPFGPNVIRASVGNIFRSFVAEATAEKTMAWLNENQMQVVISTPIADKAYDEINWRVPTAVVLGSEAHGVSSQWQGQSLASERVRLPMHGQADSLNVSTTAAVLFYEAVRQRRAASKQA